MAGLDPLTNILLLGPRGCGKSTVGRVLAVRTGRPFVDLDERTLARFTDGTVTAVWRQQGEAAWRRAEAATLVDALRSNGQVLALGGGTPIISAGRETIDRARGEGRAWAVYLHCPPAVLRQRLAGAPGDRPPLTDAGTIDEVESVLAAREPTYRAVADLVCDMAELDPDAAAAAVAARFIEALAD